MSSFTATNFAPAILQAATTTAYDNKKKKKKKKKERALTGNTGVGVKLEDYLLSGSSGPPSGCRRPRR